MSLTQSIKEKISKLLALAGNNPNENERAQAMDMAQKLLAQHNLSLKDIHGIGKAVKQVLPTRAEKWLNSLICAAAKLYYCEVITSYSLGKKVYVLIGSEENIAVCNDIFLWLVKAIKNEAKRQFKGDQVVQRSFRQGASVRIYGRAVELMKREEQESTGKNQLMVIRNELEKANQEFMAENFPRIKEGRQRDNSRTLDYRAYGAGESFGDKVNLGRQINGSKDCLRIEAKN